MLAAADAKSMKNVSHQPAHAAPRRGRPMRAVFGVLSALLAVVALAAALAPEGNRYGIPPVTEEAGNVLLAYGVLMFAVALWAIGTSGPRPARPAPSVADELLAATDQGGTPGPGAVDVPDVITPLRGHGWYVAENVSLPHADADYIAVGPAGVLVVQTMVSTVADPRGRASIRARVAAQQLEKVLRQQEVHVEVVPAVVAFGPGQDDTAPGGVRIVDHVAILFGDQVDRWFPALTEKEHINAYLQERVREAVGDLLEGKAAQARPLAPVT